MPKYTKDKYKDLLKKGEAEELIELLSDNFKKYLQTYSEDGHCQKIYDDLILLSRRQKNVLTDKNRGVIDYSELQKETAKIDCSLLENINQLPQHFIDFCNGKDINISLLNENLSSDTKEKSEVEITLEGIISQFDNEKKRILISTVAAILNIDESSIRVKRVVSGSIKVTLELPMYKGLVLLEFSRWNGFSEMINSVTGGAIQIMNIAIVKGKWWWLKVFIDKVKLIFSRSAWKAGGLFIVPVVVLGVVYISGGLTEKNELSENDVGSKVEIDFIIQVLEKNMKTIPGSTFTMGCKEGRDENCRDNEKPAYSVILPSFKMNKYEVSQEEWRAVMGSDPEELRFKDCDKCPVERVSWDDVQDFLKKLNKITGKKYRLPTETEWEYAARGGEDYQYAGSNVLDDVAWHYGNSGGETHIVGQKRTNGYGLYDMSGNVWEWCEDEWHSDYNGAPKDGSAWKGGENENRRMVRGGSWDFNGFSCRVSVRNLDYRDDRYNDLGFRLVRY